LEIESYMDNKVRAQAAAYSSLPWAFTLVNAIVICLLIGYSNSVGVNAEADVKAPDAKSAVLTNEFQE
jgi:hypothetical protein